MPTLFVLFMLVLVALALAVPMIRKRNVLGEVDRFQHARSLTTSWSSPSQGDVPQQKPPTHDE